jgi:muramidase (phage lysozyme)
MPQHSVKKFFRNIRRDKRSLLAIIIAGLLAVFGIVVHTMVMNRHSQLDVSSVRPLLDLIGHAESRNNYNAHFGNANNRTVNFTDMTIQEVRTWQEQFIANGSPSSAVGRYQIISTTLDGLVKDMQLTGKEKFDRATQDRMAIRLLERRGALLFVDNSLSREGFAANLAQEWASLPRITGDRPTESYYAGDGLNKSLIAPDAVLQAVENVRKKEG